MTSSKRIEPSHLAAIVATAEIWQYNPFICVFTLTLTNPYLLRSEAAFVAIVSSSVKAILCKASRASCRGEDKAQASLAVAFEEGQSKRSMVMVMVMVSWVASRRTGKARAALCDATQHASLWPSAKAIDAELRRFATHRAKPVHRKALQLSVCHHLEAFLHLQYCSL